MRSWNLLWSWLKRKDSRRPLRRYLRLEEMEDRAVPATFMVNTTADDFFEDANTLSLREAIEVLNAPALFGLLSANEAKQIDLTNPIGTDDTILFALGNGQQIISPTAANGALPSIVNPVYIDGDNPAYPNQIVQLDGKLLADGNVADAHGLHLKTSDSAIRNLAITRFTGDGIRIESPDAEHTQGFNLIDGNRIGTVALGVDLGNTGAGIRILNSSHNTIGFKGNGNTIYKNLGGGIVINGEKATDNYVIGNTISSNTAYGILVESSAHKNVIGIEDVNFFGEGNTIIDNTGDGIILKSDNNKVTGNLIGIRTDWVKGARSPNTGNGIEIWGNKNDIGGHDVRLRNIISANKEHGVEISGNENTLIGNFIGLTIDGQGIYDQNDQLTGNVKQGIYVTGEKNRIGVEEFRPNVISGNQENGVYVQGKTLNKVRNNQIGMAADSPVPLTNAKSAVRVENARNTDVLKNKGYYTPGQIAIDIDDNSHGSVEEGNEFSRDPLAAAGPVVPAIRVRNSDDVVIGGLAADDANVIDSYISIEGSAGVVVQGNFIGQDSQGTPDANAGLAILIDADSSNVTIGGLATGAGNHIFSNGGVGIQSSGTNVVIQDNDLDQDEGVDVQIEAGTAWFTQLGIASLLLDGGNTTFEDDSSADDVAMTAGNVGLAGDDDANLSVAGAFAQTGGTILLAGGEMSATGGLSIGASATLTGHGSITADVSTAGSVSATPGLLGGEALLIAGDYTQTGGTTEVEDTFEVTGLLHLIAGSITAEYQLQPLTIVAGSFLQSGGSFSLYETTLLVDDDLEIEDGNFTLSFTTLEVGGDFVMDDGAALVENVDGSITNQMQLNGGTLQLHLCATFTVTGGVSIGTAGWLDLLSAQILGNVSNAGTLSVAHLPDPLAGDTSSISGNYTQSSSGTLIVDVDWFNNDVLAISGAATLDGTFVLNGLDGYDPPSFTTLTPLTFGSRSGTFSSLDLPIPGSGTWIDTYTSTYFELFLDEEM